jgi:hypothetical protein
LWGFTGKVKFEILIIDQKAFLGDFGLPLKKNLIFNFSKLGYFNIIQNFRTLAVLQTSENIEWHSRLNSSYKFTDNSKRKKMVYEGVFNYKEPFKNQVIPNFQE